MKHLQDYLDHTSHTTQPEQLLEGMSSGGPKEFLEISKAMLEVGRQLGRSKGEPGRMLGTMVRNFAGLLLSNPKKLDLAMENMRPLFPKLDRLKELGDIWTDESLAPLEIDQEGWHQLLRMCYGLWTGADVLSKAYGITPKTVKAVGLLLAMCVHSLGDRDIMDELASLLS